MQIFEAFTTAGKIVRVGMDTLFNHLKREEIKIEHPADKEQEFVLNVNRAETFLISDIPSEVSFFEKYPYRLVPINDKMNFTYAQFVLKHLPLYQKMDLTKIDNLEDALEEAAVGSLYSFGEPTVFLTRQGPPSNDLLIVSDIRDTKIYYGVDKDNLEVVSCIVNHSPLKTVVAKIQKDIKPRRKR